MRPRQHCSEGFLRHQLLTATVVKGGHAEASVKSLEKSDLPGQRSCICTYHVAIQLFVCTTGPEELIIYCGIDRRQSS